METCVSKATNVIYDYQALTLALIRLTDTLTLELLAFQVAVLIKKALTVIILVFIYIFNIAVKAFSKFSPHKGLPAFQITSLIFLK